MASLLDTSVISQRVKERPEERVLEWLRSLPEEEAFLSVVTLEEIRYGIERMEQSRKRERYETWLTRDLRLAFAGRVLVVDERIADEAGRLCAAGRKAGAEPELADALIAATARVHALTLATLNLKHFREMAVVLVEF